MKLRLPPALAADFAAARDAWRERDGTRRLFAGDPTLWTGGPEAGWLGWLDAPAAALAGLDAYREIAADGRSFRHVLVLGMGGSSLAPEVQRAALGDRDGHPRVVVLDSIHPDQVAACEAALDLSSTLVVVASKSGSTLEPNLLLAHFAARLAAAVGAHEAPRRIVAVTDPGSSLERSARERGYRRVVAGEPTIGGRFSALSPFGLVPAALQGIELDAWLGGAAAMAASCRDDDPLANPGVSLGLLLGTAAAQGRDKLTLRIHPQVAVLGAWLEQLVAESTGKRGRAVLPFEGEPLAPPDVYGDDRLFVAVRLGGELAEGDDERLDALAAAGQPVVELDLDAAIGLGAELYRWEIATAVAGAELGVDPFDQPDVEAAKLAARQLAAEIERSGSLPAEAPFYEDDELAIYVPEAQVRLIRAGAGEAPQAVDVLHAHLARLVPGDYFALLAFCPMSETTIEAAARARAGVLTGNRVATSVGFGPRYLHSTGQAHKGGPASGLFLLVSDTPTL
ncbi:MAG: transaldolase, partial [Thermoanaerobaculia bacterium]|nr:transaldolase [Thermoanaerobaculia bacterium]